MIAGKLNILIDGQWGSTGKGKLAGFLALRRMVDVAVCDFMPNAGHIHIEDDEKVILHQLPTAGVVGSSKDIFLGPGCAINPHTLLGEIERYDVNPTCIHLHPNASIVTAEGIRAECSGPQVAIASTLQGCSTAVMNKMERRQDGAIARDYGDLAHLIDAQWEQHLFHHLENGQRVLVESAGGVDLSLDSSFYPYVTSRNINIPAIMDRVGGWHPSYLGLVYGCVRTFPIRVGNIIDDEGAVLGVSGGVYEGQEEIEWKDIGVEPEKTTTTQRERRVFQWSDKQFQHFLRLANPDILMLNFVDYLVGGTPIERVRYNWSVNDSANPPRLLHDAVQLWLDKHIRPWYRNPIWCGTGPDVTEVALA